MNNLLPAQVCGAEFQSRDMPEDQAGMMRIFQCVRAASVTEASSRVDLGAYKS
jgi:hypothetical protein